jgi:predicted Zn-ribbon and HTH transcriptional regulator
MHGRGHLVPGRPFNCLSVIAGRAMSLTLRQTLALILSQRECSAYELAEELMLTPAEVESHLGHLKLSHKNKFQMRPARCGACGYVFKNRKRLDAPGRCPRCKAERAEGPWFSINA